METSTKVRVGTLALRLTDRLVPLGEGGPAGSMRAPQRVVVVVESDRWRYEIEQRLIDGRYRTAGLKVEATGDEWLDLEELRRAHLRSWLRYGLAHTVVLDSPEGTFSADSPMSPDPLWSTALTYTIARATGDNPTSAVAEDFGLSHSAAAQRVARARKAGYLPPTTRGKVH